MVKNFSKAIFSYIRKNRQRVAEVLRRLAVSEHEFMVAVEQARGRIHSIKELRSLWSEDGHPFNKAFRVLSHQYLREHCMAKTFNSRIENYGVHLKYRQRLLEGLTDPSQFTVLKTN